MPCTTASAYNFFRKLSLSESVSQNSPVYFIYVKYADVCTCPDLSPEQIILSNKYGDHLHSLWFALTNFTQLVSQIIDT
jgi:hypothetical protein